MQFLETELQGVFIVDPEFHRDTRGSFARTYCEKEFHEVGIDITFCQCNISFNHRRGTLRGMHFQKHPVPEGKLVRVTSGAIYDVALDLRQGSGTYCKWVGVELNADTHRALYIPPGLAHGFQTLTDSVEVFYQMTAFYNPELASGCRWNDPAFNIQWPIGDPILSQQDANYPDFDRDRHTEQT